MNPSKKVPKYPCGICTTGVKHEAIKCTGKCHSWFHWKCLDPAERNFKKIGKLTTEEINHWTCKSCKINDCSINHSLTNTSTEDTPKPNSPIISTPLKHIEDKILNIQDGDIKNVVDITDSNLNTGNCSPNTSFSQNAIDDIQSKILNNENTDLETSLTLAAEIGNVLLAENSKLKQDVFDLTLKNSELAQLVKNVNYDAEVNYQSTIDDLESDKEALTNRTSTLLEAVKQLETQLEKEKAMRNELALTFENHDKQQIEIINQYKKLTSEHSKTIKSLEAKLIKFHCATQTDPQTAPLSPNTVASTTSNSVLLTEIAQLKLRQDEAESTVQISISNLLSEIAQLKLRQDQWESPTMKSPPLISIGPKINPQNNKKNNTSRPKVHTLFPMPPPTPCTFHKKSNNKKNHFSISLKVCKFQEECKTTPNQPQLPLKCNKNTFKITKSPPITATKLKPTESFQEFYNRNIVQVKLSHQKSAIENSINQQASSQNSSTFLGEGTPSPSCIRTQTELPIKLTE